MEGRKGILLVLVLVLIYLFSFFLTTPLLAPFGGKHSLKKSLNPLFVFVHWLRFFPDVRFVLLSGVFLLQSLGL